MRSFQAQSVWPSLIFCVHVSGRRYLRPSARISSCLLEENSASFSRANRHTQNCRLIRRGTMPPRRFVLLLNPYRERNNKRAHYAGALGIKLASANAYATLGGSPPCSSCTYGQEYPLFPTPFNNHRPVIPAPNVNIR